MLSTGPWLAHGVRAAACTTFCLRCDDGVAILASSSSPFFASTMPRARARDRLRRAFRNLPLIWSSIGRLVRDPDGLWLSLLRRTRARA